MSDNDKSLVPITQETLAYIRTQSKRTKVEPVELLKCVKDAPEGLTPDTIDYWLSGECKTARLDQLRYVMAKWKQLPTYEHEFITITDHIQTTLLEYKRLLGAGPQALMWGFRHEKPEGLRPGEIKKWLAGTKQIARKDHLDYVLYKWSTLTALKQERVQLTDNIIGELLRQRKRSRVSPQILLRSAKNIPHGLTTEIIRQWLYRKTTTAQKNHLEYVLHLWRSLPDSKIQYAKGRSKHLPYTMSGCVEITEETRNALREYKNRTGINPARFLKDNHNAPQGLTVSVVNGWIYGRTETALVEHLEYIFAQYKKLET